nr:hypothetical protein Iba_contig4659CG0010 [Ipomoea batatas]GME21585.1 hypothetical protein Iba_scaffold28403CG0010 [Ipomoea batatas]
MSLSSLLCSVLSSSTPDSSRRRQLWLRIFSSHGSFSGEIKETKSGLKMALVAFKLFQGSVMSQACLVYASSVNFVAYTRPGYKS